MTKMDEKELMNVEGGIGTWAALGIISGIIFLIGVIDGFVRPRRCS